MTGEGQGKDRDKDKDRDQDKGRAARDLALPPEVARRLEALPPEKRRLFEERLRREGIGERPVAPAAADAPEALGVPEETGPLARPLAFSVFFFSADGTREGAGKYDLMLEVARLADREGLAAVWTPERHFQAFGGLYPNPAVTGAALAVATERIAIRAGSVVLPLHHPIRVAEDWAVVDNLSGGRAGISCAAGWHPSDFMIRPETFEERKEVMFRDIDTLRRLWRGETVTLPGGDGEPYEARINPRPVQAELPLWVTSSGSPRTWERAGEVGANLLASMGSQPEEDLAAKVRRYREARRRAGHDPEAGIVSLMLHVHLTEDPAEARERSREPLEEYLRTHMAQRDSYLDLPEGITPEDREALIPLAFDHYVRSASLIGSAATGRPLLGRLAALGVDEIACLVDFGVERPGVLETVERLGRLSRELEAERAEVEGVEAERAEAGSMPGEQPRTGNAITGSTP